MAKRCDRDRAVQIYRRSYADDTARRVADFVLGDFVNDKIVCNSEMVGDVSGAENDT